MPKRSMPSRKPASASSLEVVDVGGVAAVGQLDPVGRDAVIARAVGDLEAALGCRGWVCTMTGAPVCRWAAATARSTRSTPGVMPAWSMAHLSSPARTPVPAMPSVRSRTKKSTIGSGPAEDRAPGPRWRKKNGHVVVGVDAGGDDDVEVDLLVDALDAAG